MNLEQDTENSGSHNECVDRQGDVHRWNTTAQQVGMFNFIHIHPLQLLSCLWILVEMFSKLTYNNQ